VVHEIREPAGMSLSPESAKSGGASRTKRSRRELRFINSLRLHHIQIENRKSPDTGFQEAGIEK
jgi:hypothetical protein